MSTDGYLDSEGFSPDIIIANNRTTEGTDQPLGVSQELGPAPPPEIEENNKTTKTGKKAKKEYIKHEENILSGDASVIPNPNYKAKNTMKLEGLGILTGLYYVNKVTHTFSKDGGYQQTLSLSRNGLGDTLKRGNVPVIPPATTTQDTGRPAEISASSSASSGKTHTVGSGDTLWGLAKTYYGDGSQYMKIYNANTDKLSNPNMIIDGQVLTIPD